MNLANRITIARIFLIPVILLFLLVRFDFGHFSIGGHTTTVSEIVAVLMFIVAAATDGLDGYIARKRKMVTNFGKFLDPLADKLLVTAALVSLVEMDRIGALAAIIIIFREFVISGLRTIAASEGIVLAASKLGKLKTTLQIIAISALILNNFPFSYIGLPFADIMLYVAVFVTIWSGIDYLWKNKHVIYSGRI
ncbi:CDP-diacylglycerol--glycerol-3-phosphate 3-phosphatidyltransferase [Effusibacillus lacus]|uniref:CDP-diacylglycerol--glycerol-3-phosphate 3-phosphatidyltransferase n=1 Tax=Effusibacillus lacus TaxID=1348429 RepID=A0A292YTP1_9BACL|nr:CDP-diacylglycerol--glycerol-3-phosphate 3-phosphatidyltransferase [Effusibacillus lacus]TCS76256.1 CDP-diacylglycerol--glycerol-3-phosphate 3-phosphatidyltransferase [Effusibacillus lacus]GAX91804.1 CDP-diacylglycerol--glycerol-3-phosphate 3-phosphatidyltransferase [Effusibacillus lacus]